MLFKFFDLINEFMGIVLAKLYHNIFNFEVSILSFTKINSYKLILLGISGRLI